MTAVIAVFLSVAAQTVTSHVSDADTPELFLEALSEAAPSQWVEYMTAEEPRFHPDTVLAVTEAFQELSVETGPRELQDFEGGYYAIFPESRWTWRLPGGRIGSIAGETIVQWKPGGYRWVTVPFFTARGAEVGPREKLCMGIISMAVVMLITMVGVWYAKRRYG